MNAKSEEEQMYDKSNSWRSIFRLIEERNAKDKLIVYPYDKLDCESVDKNNLWKFINWLISKQRLKDSALIVNSIGAMNPQMVGHMILWILILWLLINWLIINKNRTDMQEALAKTTKKAKDKYKERISIGEFWFVLLMMLAGLGYLVLVVV